MSIAEEEGYARAESMTGNFSYDAEDGAVGMLHALMAWARSKGVDPDVAWRRAELRASEPGKHR